MWQRVVDMLRDIPPAGPAVTAAILASLNRELHWLQWKKDSCPPFEKQPAATAPAAFVSRKRKTIEVCFVSLCIMLLRPSRVVLMLYMCVRVCA